VRVLVTVDPACNVTVAGEADMLNVGGLNGLSLVNLTVAGADDPWA